MLTWFTRSMVYEVKVSKDELGVMLIATVRYALGRQSYFPGIAQDLLKKILGSGEQGRQGRHPQGHAGVSGEREPSEWA